MNVPMRESGSHSAATKKLLVAVTRAAADAAGGWEKTGVTKVCVALSGGVDSVVLLHVLSELAKQQSFWTLSAHHVHHGLSANADAWEAYCASVCDALAIPFACTRVNVDRNAGIGVEAAAREARYHALDALDTDVVALAHHARDHAETVLLQLLRGSGPAGLAAMPRRAGRYERPLLNTPRSAIEAYAFEHALTWMDDESNLDARFSRNRLRLKVWPALVNAFPSAETTLSRAATLQAEATVLLADLAAIDLKAISDDGVPRVPRLLALSPERRANVLRHWLASEGLPVPSADTLREWLKQLASTNQTQAIQLGFAKDGARVRVYRDQLSVERPIGDWRAVPWTGESGVALGAAGTVSFSEALDSVTTSLRQPVAGERWLIRKRLPGDRVKLSASSGHVSLKNVMQNAGVAPWRRDVWPLLICNNQIAAIAGLLTAYDYKVRAGERGLTCEWKPACGQVWRS